MIKFQKKCKEIYEAFGVLVQQHIENHGWESFCGFFYINRKESGDIMMYASGETANNFRRMIRNKEIGKANSDGIHELKNAINICKKYNAMDSDTFIKEFEEHLGIEIPITAHYRFARLRNTDFMQAHLNGEILNGKI